MNEYISDVWFIGFVLSSTKRGKGASKIERGLKMVDGNWITFEMIF